MELLSSLLSLDPVTIGLIPVVGLVLYYVLPFLIDRYKLIGYPGPFLAKFSSLWFARLAYNGINISEVHKWHENCGNFVRIGPNQISIAHPDALQTIYGTSSRAIKSELYDAFVMFGRKPSMFATKSREEHTRKRKYLSHAMSMKSIQEFEPNVSKHQQLLVKRWDILCDAGGKGESGQVGACVWRARDGRVWFNCQQWYNYDAFDVIGDLAFGQPEGFGMLQTAQDAAPVAVSAEQAMRSFYDKNAGPVEMTTVPAVKIINEATAFNLFLGCLPKRWRGLVMQVPSVKQDMMSRAALGRMAVTAVAKRISSDVTRNDFLAKLLVARDEHGNRLDENELSAEATSLLVAGSDTTANSLGAITFYLAQNQQAQAKLQAELDAALGPPGGDASDEGVVPPYEHVKHLPYLLDAINEGLRIHSTGGMGFPREVPESGMTIAGKYFPAGTVVGCPLLTLHRLKSVWGEDADEYNPDRWSRGDRAEMLKAFAPFQVGPRACIGRNLAMMEITICVATVFHRYHLVLKNPKEPLAVHEGFLRKPLAVHVGMKRRA